MKLNSISIGGGLALVAIGLLANAAASLVGSPERTANADDLKRGAKQPQPVADVAVSSADEGGAEMMAGSGCVIEGEPLNWFGAIRQLPACLHPYDTPRLANLFSADVDASGNQDFFEASRNDWILPPSGATAPPSLLRKVGFAYHEGQVEASRTSVLETARVAAWLTANTTFTEAFLDENRPTNGWFDVDGDGDLDLVLEIQGFAGSWNIVRIWLENTGFEKQTFAAGDINQDGAVDGVDISILLSDWTY